MRSNVRWRKDRDFVIIFFSFSINLLITGDASILLDFLQDAQIPEPTLIHACTILTQDGKISPNSTSAVDRLLMETVSMVPQIHSSRFEQNELSHAAVVCNGCYTLFLSALLHSTGPADHMW